MTTATDEISGTTLPPTMNAIVLDRFGGVDELTHRVMDLPTISNDDVLIRVAYAGVGSWDPHEREGHYDGIFGAPSAFPYVLGWDAAGTVAAVGSNVTRFAPGDRVYAAGLPALRHGFYAEYGAVEAEHVAHLPEQMPMDQAGALAWDALTAMNGVETLDLQRNQTLMVFGASGGVGHLALQFARNKGIRVFAAASGADGVALARHLGADAVVDGRREDVAATALEFAPDGVDAALVTVNSDAAVAALRAVKKSGRIAFPHGVPPLAESVSEAAVFGFDGDRTRGATDRLNAIIAAGELNVHIAHSFPLDRARDAHRAVSQHYIGKVVLTLS